jgi:pimeloyl-ACP methyl ester carboxylesterase
MLVDKPHRRRFLSTAAVTIVAAQLGTFGRAQSNDATESLSEGNTAVIRPFHVHVPQADLDDLNRRVAQTRWSDRETVADSTQGVQQAVLQDLARYWSTDYSWRKCEAKLNALPQFLTEIDGVDIHFIHVRSSHARALPVIITHGWPGSIIEQLKLIAPLTNPTAHGGSAADAFHVMTRLGYDKYVAQGGDVGFSVTSALAKQAPPGLAAMHTNFPWTVPSDIAKAMQCGEPAPPGLPDDETLAYKQLQDFTSKHFAYGAMMGTRPQTLAALNDSPLGLAAWIIDHGDGWAQPAATVTSALAGQTIDGHSAGALTRDDFLDNITLYWLTQTAISAARVYWETRQAPNPIDVTIPAAATIFPGELYQAPRRWVESGYHNLVYYNRVDQGGHYAAWEQPELFSQELRAAFRSVR